MNYIEMVARNEGREEVREEFRQNQVEVFLQMARTKFDDVPQGLEKQIRAAKLEHVNDWLSRLLTASNLDSLIAAPATG